MSGYVNKECTVPKYYFENKVFSKIIFKNKPIRILCKIAFRRSNILNI
jgi:hypothetical protein